MINSTECTLLLLKNLSSNNLGSPQPLHQSDSLFISPKSTKPVWLSRPVSSQPMPSSQQAVHKTPVRHFQAQEPSRHSVAQQDQKHCQTQGGGKLGKRITWYWFEKLLTCDRGCDAGMRGGSVVTQSAPCDSDFVTVPRHLPSVDEKIGNTPWILLFNLDHTLAKEWT